MSPSLQSLVTSRQIRHFLRPFFRAGEIPFIRMLLGLFQSGKAFGGHFMGRLLGKPCQLLLMEGIHASLTEEGAKTAGICGKKSGGIFQIHLAASESGQVPAVA